MNTYNIINTKQIIEMPVNDIELEKKILKTILLQQKNIDYLDVLVEEDFYSDANKKVYMCFRDLTNESLDIDTIPPELKRSKEFKDVMLIDPLFNYELPVYIERLQKITQQRKIQRLALEATVRVKEGKSPAEITNWLTDEFSKFTVKTQEDIEKQNMRINTELLEELQKEDYFGLTSGYSKLDNYIKGFANGTITILGGTPSVGKTTWLLNIINHLCRKGKRVLSVNLEMSNIMLQMKMLSIITGISTSLLMSTRKNLSDSGWKQITEALNTMSSYKWFRIGEKEVTTATIDNTIKEQGGFDIVVVDYLQLMSPVVHKKSRYEDVSNISRELKRLATKHDIPFIVISSINREYALRESKMPVISDLRESGNIEYDADLILFLTRKSLFEKYEEYYKNSKDKNKMDEFEFEHHAELMIAKNRFGYANKIIDFYFDGEKSLFKEMKTDEN